MLCLFELINQVLCAQYGSNDPSGQFVRCVATDLCDLFVAFVLFALCAEFVHCAPCILSCVALSYCMCASSLFHVLKPINVVVNCCQSLKLLHLLHVLQLLDV